MMTRESHDYKTITSPIEALRYCYGLLHGIQSRGRKLTSGEIDKALYLARQALIHHKKMQSEPKTIADHYQQASLHLETAAGHLLEIEKSDPIYAIPLTTKGYWYAGDLTELSRLLEWRAQAALQETKS